MDGEKYIGQTSNIVGRFAAHRARWADVVQLNFVRIGEGELNTRERDLIHVHQMHGEMLRNITHALGSGLRDSAPDLDHTVTVEDQHAWLASGEVGLDVEERVENVAMRQRGREKFAKLMVHPLGGAAVLTAQRYVQATILRPRAAELTFWASSAMPATNASVAPRLIGISINKMETFVVGWDVAQRDAIWGFVNVSRSVLIDAYGSLPKFSAQRATWLDIDEPMYEAGGGDVVSLYVYSAPDMMNLLLDERTGGVINAARKLNLRLMRKGPTLQWRWHCFDLADQLLAPLPSSSRIARLKH